jgi:hypothetical protein
VNELVPLDVAELVKGLVAAFVATSVDGIQLTSSLVYYFYSDKFFSSSRLILVTLLNYNKTL